MSSCPVVVGVDGGGTSTEVVVGALDGSVIGRAVGGPSNWEAIGVAAMATEVATTVAAALAAAGCTRHDVVAAAYGMAGVDWPPDVAVVGDALGAAGLGWPSIVVNDAFVALRAGTDAHSGWGIVSSVGTGAVTAGVNRAGATFRTMAVGWGEPSGASSLARDAVHAVAAAHHGTAPPTTLTESVVAALRQGSVLEMFEAISRRRVRVGADLAPLVTAAAERGDPVAIDIVTASAVAHAAMVVGVADHLAMREEDVELVTSGGLHRAGGLWCERFAAAIDHACPSTTIVPLQTSPAVGALALALDLAGTGPVSGRT